MPRRPRGGASIQRLQQLLDTLRFLRSDNGCPWDRKQSLADMCRYLLEEAYELQEAVRDGDASGCAEELGDVLFLVLSCSIMLEQSGGPGLEEIAARTDAKIVRRHPHVFADKSARSPEEGVRHWRDMKEREARERGQRPPRLLERLPRALPPLHRALKVQREVASVGFEWETAEQVHAKILEEARELQEAMQNGDRRRIEDELGDMLFSVVNLARRLEVDPESALGSTVAKFVQRFAYVEDGLRARGRSLAAASLQEMDALWEESKRQEQSPRGSEPCG